MTSEEVEQAIRKAHILNRALFILKIVKEKLPLSQTSLKLYLDSVYNGLHQEKDEMKVLYKKYDIKLIAPDKDLEPVFIEAESLAKSSFPHRALGFIAAMRRWSFLVEVYHHSNNPTMNEDIKFSYQLFKDMLENPNE
jgi:hypothetical protein